MNDKIIPWEVHIPTGRLYLNENVAFTLYGKLPCKFHRIMIKLFFGFWYEDLSDEAD